MTSGILTNWYISKIRKASTPTEYCAAVLDFVTYNINMFGYNLKPRV